MRGDAERVADILEAAGRPPRVDLGPAPSSARKAAAGAPAAANCVRNSISSSPPRRATS
jgi:hypothetical protein